eukprot:CAMPEP_0196667760 /NCGR_PEP_ID=MMETSP1086-20130531/65259_1 /TAXON_ID=77921 /ORGANISM="Cyanoptyche  gloeocystis , Strain SAG4.97" /LENGTH=172 /DNA_ID=CAMNT_0042005119 /DNA_START=120 /DNA_END=635 /DNA_ORIENTATION=+
MSYFHAVSLSVNRAAKQSLPRTRSGKRSRARAPSLPCIAEEEEHQHLFSSAKRINDTGASFPSALNRCEFFLNPCFWKWKTLSPPPADSILDKHSQPSCSKEEQKTPLNSRAALEYFPAEDDDEDLAESSPHCAVVVMRDEVSSDQWSDPEATNSCTNFNHLSAVRNFASEW